MTLTNYKLNIPVVDPDFELRGEGEEGGLLALLAYLPSVISLFFTQNKVGGGGGGSWTTRAPPLDPPLHTIQKFQEWLVA